MLELDLSWFFNKIFIRSKQKVNTLVLIFFGRPLLEHRVKTNCIKFLAFDAEICSILIFVKILV